MSDGAGGMVSEIHSVCKEWIDSRILSIPLPILASGEI
jgi:hypothetical protein